MTSRKKSPTRPPTAIGLQPLLVDVRGGGALLGISPALFRRLDLTGRLGPQAYSLGTRRRLWRTSELEAWVRAGMPRRGEWLNSAPAGAPNEVENNRKMFID